MAAARVIPSLTLVVILAACGGDPTGPGDNNPPVREIKAAPSFSTDVNEIFQRRGCTGGSCHGAPNGQGGLRLTSSASANYAALVNVDASSEAFKRVLPNDATNSYLVIKLEGRQSVGSRMPLNLSPLDNIDLTNIRNWIGNGAPQN